MGGPVNPEQVIVGGGTAGLILVLALAVRELWAVHKARDAKTEAERDEALALAKEAIGGTAKISDGVQRLTSIVERLASRQRSYDRDDGHSVEQKRG